MASRLKSPGLLDAAERRWGPRSSWSCVFCGRSVPDGAVDHFVPRERGGTDLPWNLVPACGRCNSSKKAHDPFAWMRAVGVSASAVSALEQVTRSPDWRRAGSGHRYPRFTALDYGAAADLPRAVLPTALPRNLAEVFVLDESAWAPVTALRRIAAGYLADLGRPALSSQQLNRELDSRGLARTKRRGVYGYRGFYVSAEAAASGRFAVGAEGTAAARRAERVRRSWALAGRVEG